MKKRILVLLAALLLLLGSAVLAGAMETTTPDGESWRVDEDAFKEQYMSDYAEDHKAEFDAFDADAYARETGWVNESMDEETFRREMWRECLKLEDEAEWAFNAYIGEKFEKTYPGELGEKGIPWALMIYGWESVEEMAAEIEENKGDVEAVRRQLAAAYVRTRQNAAYNHEKALEYRTQYPGVYESYDPDEGFEGYWVHMKDNIMARYGIRNEVEWKEWRYVQYMREDYFREQEQAAEARRKEERFQTLLQEEPERYAAFDPYAWFDGYYGTYGAVLETYMHNWGLDEAGFKREMFMEWADRTPTAFFNGCCVTVDGTPIQFQSYRDLNGGSALPRVEGQRIFIPLRAAAEALGLTVEWKAEANQVVCSDENTTVTFTIDSTEYSGGVLDVAPYAENGVTYLPLRALGETLGCGMTWYQDFATAALTTAK